jgi:DNA-binding CsgD family transcriptional regulator
MSVAAPHHGSYDRRVDPNPAPHEPNGKRTQLSQRELEVLQMAAEGLTNAAMARRLCLSVHGVKFHLSSVYRKLGVSNRTEAVAHLLTAPPAPGDGGQRWI